MPQHSTATASTTPATETTYDLPPVGDNPSTLQQGTTPGSFANRGQLCTPWTFSSPDTPGMPAPSDKTAWDFLPDGWRVRKLPADAKLDTDNPYLCYTGDRPSVTSATAAGEVLEVLFRKHFEPLTQLESVRLGSIRS